MSKSTNISKVQSLSQIEEDAELRKGTENLYRDVCDIIDNVRGEIANYVNTKICLTKWDVGKRIKEDVLFNRRAEYGKQIVKNLSKQLTEKYGAGWSDRSLLHCIRAAYTFSREDIVYATRTQLTYPRKVAQYYTQLPDRKLLAEKYHRAIAIARELQAEKDADGHNEK